MTTRRIVPLEQPPIIEDEALREWLSRTVTMINAALNRKSNLEWLGTWEEGFYEEGSIVFIDGYLMVSNKDTTEYPAPIPQGEAYWISGEGDNPTWSFWDSAPTKILYTGVRSTTLTTGYYTSIRYWVDDTNPDIKYQLFSVNNDVTPAEIKPITTESVGYLVGWQYPLQGSALTVAGSIKSLFLSKTNSASSTSATFTWDYSTPNNDTVPATGQITHANKSIDKLLINKTDSTGTDRNAELSLLLPGDDISVTGLTWSILSSTESTDYWSFEITPYIQSSDEDDKDVTLITFQALPINYPFIPDHYTGNYFVRGLYTESSMLSPSVNGNMYGVDLQFQQAKIPEDWDFMAYSEL